MIFWPCSVFVAACESAPFAASLSKYTTHWLCLICGPQSDMAHPTGTSSSSKIGCAEWLNNLSISRVGTFSAKYWVSSHSGLTKMAPNVPSLFCSPSQAPSLKISQVLRFVDCMRIGGADKTLSLKNSKAISSAPLSAFWVLPWEAKLLSFLNACCAKRPPAKLSNHCNRPLKRSASLGVMTPDSRKLFKTFSTLQTCSLYAPGVLLLSVPRASSWTAPPTSSLLYPNQLLSFHHVQTESPTG